MKYLGNYIDWVENSWIDFVKNNVGKTFPKGQIPIDSYESQEFKAATDAGYDLDKVLWYVFEKDDTGFDIVPTWTEKSTSWWITKLLPGQYMPMHRDPFTQYRNCKRYWMPLTDYQPGHIFIYKDTFVNDYKAGDLYRYDLSTEIHGAANIGHSVRIILQITEYI
jgi:hypothetical protein